MIKVTEKAIEKIVEISDAEGIGHYSIRFKLFGSGCAGFQFDLEFDSVKKDNDLSFNFDKITVLVDEVTHEYMQNITLDYITRMMESGFKFSSPDIKGSCGCGKSVEF